MNPKRICACSLFVALFTVSAYIRIPMPFMPLTFQGQICLVCGMLLSPKSSAVTSSAYLTMGVLGLPVFASSAGLGFFTEPTAGYILSFIPASCITSLLCKKCNCNSTGNLYLASLPGLFIIEFFGSGYLYLIYTYYLKTAINLFDFIVMGFLVTTAKDLLVNIPFCKLTKRIRPALSRI